MPRMIFVCDGPLENAQPGKSVEISFEELAALCDSAPHFISDQPMAINPSDPAMYPNRVVIRVLCGAVRPPRFPKAGYYLLPKLSPESAARRLDEIRGD